MKKFQQLLTLTLSFGFLAVFSVWFLISPAAGESTVERRRLAKRPALSLSSVANGSFMSGFEAYMLVPAAQRLPDTEGCHQRNRVPAKG